MTRCCTQSRRALTLLELTLALSITAMVGAAICGMMHAVTTGVSTRKDSRSLMIRSNAAQLRLAAYIMPARCLLAADQTHLVLWLEDSRQSDTVHATEIRWISFDAASKSLILKYVKFPDSWSQTAKDLADKESSKDADWAALLSYYESLGRTATMPLVDGLASAAIRTDQAQAQSSRRAMFDLDVAVEDGSWSIEVAAAVRVLQPPIH